MCNLRDMGMGGRRKACFDGAVLFANATADTRDLAGTNLAMPPERVERAWQGVNRRNSSAGGSYDGDCWRDRRWRGVGRHHRIQDG